MPLSMNISSFIPVRFLNMNLIVSIAVFAMLLFHSPGVLLADDNTNKQYEDFMSDMRNMYDYLGISTPKACTEDLLTKGVPTIVLSVVIPGLALAIIGTDMPFAWFAGITGFAVLMNFQAAFLGCLFSVMRDPVAVFETDYNPDSYNTKNQGLYKKCVGGGCYEAARDPTHPDVMQEKDLTPSYLSKSVPIFEPTPGGKNTPPLFGLDYTEAYHVPYSNWATVCTRFPLIDYLTIGLTGVAAAEAILGYIDIPLDAIAQTFWYIGNI